MKTTKFFYVLKNKKGKYLTDAGKRSPNIANARSFKLYEAVTYKKFYDGFGNENRIVKAQTTVTTKEVK